MPRLVISISWHRKPMKTIEKALICDKTTNKMCKELSLKGLWNSQGQFNRLQQPPWDSFLWVASSDTVVIWAWVQCTLCSVQSSVQCTLHTVQSSVRCWWYNCSHIYQQTQVMGRSCVLFHLWKCFETVVGSVYCPSSTEIDILSQMPKCVASSDTTVLTWVLVQLSNAQNP